MWLEFAKIEERTFESKDGKPYTAFELSGIKKGWQNNPDEEWSRKIFKNEATTVIEGGVARPGIGVVSFFQNAVKPGDLVSIKQEKVGNFWQITSVEDITNGTGGPLEYTPVEGGNAVPAGNASESEDTESIPAMPSNPWD